MRNAWIWIVVIVVIVVGGFIWWQSTQSANTNATPASVDTTGASQVTTDTTQTTGASSTASTTTSGTSGTTGTARHVTVTFDGNSFSPSTVTIKKGDSVTWNDASGQMWVASSPHPAHTGYDGTSRATHCAPGYTGAAPFDQCASGSTYTFTFDKVGSWPYHDHMNPSAFGTVVVTE